MNRREAMTGATLLGAGGLLPLAPLPSRRLKLVVTGGHPDDPESTSGAALP